MRLPQPEQRMRVLVRIVMIAQVVILREFRKRRAMPVIGKRRSANRGALVPELAPSAVVCGVLIVRVKAFGVVPGGRLAGLKEAVARVGSPVAAREIGLASVLP